MNEPEELDPRLVFFLENKPQIEQWLELPALEREAAKRFFRSLAVPLEEKVAELDGQPVLTHDPEKNRCLLLHQNDWFLTEDDLPLVGVGLGWERTSDFAGSYLGVFVELAAPQRDRICKLLVERGADYGLDEWRKGSHWPVYQNVRPPERFWENLHELRESLVERIATLWLQSWPTIAEVLNEVGFENEQVQ